MDKVLGIILIALGFYGVYRGFQGYGVTGNKFGKRISKNQRNFVEKLALFTISFGALITGCVFIFND